MALLMRMVFLAVCLAVVFSSGLFAQEYEYKDYTVKPGDTLWDITKSELEDAFQWPMVWKENLRINDPDLIYPGQVIRIPVRLLPQESAMIEPVAEEVPPAEEAEGAEEAEVPAEAEEGRAALEERELDVEKIRPIISREGILEGGYITRQVPNQGAIAGSPLGRTTFGIQDRLYIDTVEPVEVGAKFYVIRREGVVRHPETGKRVGTLVAILGTLEVKEAGTENLKATVIESFDKIMVGDLLDYYYEIEPPFMTGEPRKPQIDAVVVASRYMRKISGFYDVVFIDKGKRDDLREGDMFMTLIPGTNDTRNAFIQLVNLRQETAMALVIESENEVKHGDEVEGMKE
jgi:LysM repeat protein